MLLSGAVESTCSLSVCPWAFVEKKEVNSSLQEDQKEPELQKKQKRRCVATGQK